MTKHKQVNYKGDIFKVWWQCDTCGQHVSHLDKYCRECGVRFNARTDDA